MKGKILNSDNHRKNGLISDENEDYQSGIVDLQNYMSAKNNKKAADEMKEGLANSLLAVYPLLLLFGLYLFSRLIKFIY